jgi:uncharacterized protein (DUF1800 family)
MRHMKSRETHSVRRTSMQVAVAIARKAGLVVLALVGWVAATNVAAGPVEQALISHYYQSILRRAPDAGGLAYWDSEITRLRGAGQDAKETFIAMGSQFFDSPEYRALGRSDGEFLVDLYQSFFQRSPDAGGLAYWQSQLAQGVPRGVVLSGFQFSAEFNAFIGTQLGAPTARPEGALVIDFYRGYLNRLPDANGLAFWLVQFRAAQCNGTSVLASTADSISSQFLVGAEYAGRARSNADFVGDMYSSFLRRGGDVSGVQFWTSQLNAGVSRDSIRGQFLQSPEFQARLASVAAAGCYSQPVVSASADAWRLLNQATFGASEAELARVKALGIDGWISDQFQQPMSAYPDARYSHIQLQETPDCTTRDPLGNAYPATAPQALCVRDHLTLAMVQRDFFTNAVNAPDQLRQRVAWALSQILVISAVEPDLSYAYVMARYQNILFEEAFGNYETLLQRITLSPAMGNWLDMVNNDRPDGRGRVPNENYAREILQLFGIGLTELKNDGSPILDASGQPVPTYDQDDIKEFARVFTGWTYANANGTAATRKNNPYYATPMVPYPITATTGHDTNAKLLLNSVTLPANQTIQKDLTDGTRNVFVHANVGPFVGKQLIQRLVTGNPSPAYVARVAAVFNDNGSGVRGDMKSVIRAILTDPEARGDVIADPRFGSLREPVLMITGLLRALSGFTDGNRLADAAGNLGQRPYYAPTVFNYFPPDATIPGSSTLAPEFGIHTTNTAVARANLVFTIVYNGYNADATIANAIGTKVNTQQFEALAGNPAGMVDAVSMVLLGAPMPSAARDAVVAAVNAVAVTDRPNRARMAVYLVASSYLYQVQH